MKPTAHDEKTTQQKALDKPRKSERKEGTFVWQRMRDYRDLFLLAFNILLGEIHIHSSPTD